MVASSLIAMVLAAQAPAGPLYLPLQVETYPAAEAQIHTNVFALETDRDGRVIVGHGLGLAAFDGVTWRASEEAMGLVATLTRSASGEVYVGSSRGVGRLSLEPDGSPAVDWLEPRTWEERSPGMVKFLATLDDRTIYAGGDSFVFRCQPGAGADTWVDVEPGEDSAIITHVFVLRGQSYVALPRVGVRRLEGDAAVDVPGTQGLRSMDVQAVLAHGERDALVFSADHGILRWSPEGVEAWPSELGAALEGHRIYNASRLRDGGISASTSRGVLIADGDGRLRTILDETAGLASQASFGRTVEDAGGGLWAGTFGGVSRAQLGSPIRIFGKDHGIAGSILDVAHFEGRHYVATQAGLLASDPASEPGRSTTFSRVDGVEGSVHDLLVHADALWAASSEGAYRVFEGKAYLTGVTQSTTALAAADDQQLYVAGPQHLTRLHGNNPGHTEPPSWRTALESVRSLHVDAGGRLWIPGMTEQGEWKIFRMDLRTTPVQGDFLDAADGVPSQPLSLAQVGSELLLGFPQGLARYDGHTGRFLPDSSLQAALESHGGGAFNLTEGPAGGLWFWNAENRVVRATREGADWSLTQPLEPAQLANALCFVNGPEGRLWIGTTDGQLALFDPAGTEPPAPPRPQILTLVERSGARVPIEGPGLASIEFGASNMRFQFAWASFERASKNQFRSRLLGLGDDWSPWSNETYRDFPGLREGDYQLEVEARSHAGAASSPALVAFTVLPPWHRSPLAYGGLAALGLVLVGALSGLRRRGADARAHALRSELQRERDAQEALILRESELQQELEQQRRTSAQRHQLDRQVLEAQKLEAVGRLVAGVARDFSNVLTIIHGEAELGHANAALSGAGLSQKFAAIQDASERGAQLTRQLLEFSGRQPLRPRVVALGQTLADTRGMLERVVLDDVTLDLQVDPDLRPIEIDPVAFERALVNLVVNASEAMPLGGKIRISANNLDAGPQHAVQGPCVRLVVEDNGLGMEEHAASRAFDPFFSTKGPGRVSGLGLATVYGIIRQAGGQVSLESEPGTGTRVEILLPVATRLEIPRPPLPDVLSPAPKGTTALVCDCDVQVRRITSQLLERAGHQVISADSPDEALRRASAHNGRIDVLVTDVDMPGMNGPELATELARSRPTLRVVYLSGYPTEELAPGGVLAPDVRFVAKPYSTQQLLDSIAAALGSPPPATSIQAHTD